MPTLATVAGVGIVIYPGDHIPPHFHAWKDGRMAKFEIETGRLMFGSLDRRSIRKVQQWTLRNREFLMQGWEAAKTTG